MAATPRKKGIYCIEGLWDDNIRDKSTILPILDLLDKRGYCDYIYHDSATIAELEFYLKKWKVKTINKKFPILYLAFHGDKGSILINNKEEYSLEQLALFLKDKCVGKVIYFGSCSTLRMDKRLIKSFLDKTGAIAVIGYKKDIDWIQSTACDLFVFEALQQERLDNRGIKKIYDNIKSDYGNLHKILNLRIVLNERRSFPSGRRRHKIL